MNVSRNCVKSAAFAALMALSSTSALAAEAGETAMPSISRLVFGLFAVLGLLMICAYVIRRGGLTGNTGLIKVVSQCAVGTRERVVLVQVGEQQLLIGVTPQQISLLHTLTQPVAAPAAPAAGKFAEQLALLMKGQRPS